MIDKLNYQLNEKLSEIADVLVNSLDRFSNNGILAGNSGYALFMYYYYRFTGKSEFIEYGEKALSNAVDIINQQTFDPTYCSGISGLGWTCNHLVKHNFIGSQQVSFLKDLDDYLNMFMEKCFKENNYDFLHGGLGIGYYMINRNQKVGIDLLLKYLNASRIENLDGSIKWLSYYSPESDKLSVNISLSHGISGIIACLIKTASMNKAYNKSVSTIIKAAMLFVFRQQNQQQGISRFPTYSQDDINKTLWSRLGWCYGDLGIAYTLFRGAKILKNDAWIYEALDILQYNATRKDIKKNAVFDAGVCHGSSGIAHLFWRLYLETKKTIFLESSEYWYNKTLEFAKYESGPAKYKKWIEKDILFDDFSLLEGTVGIGLCIISKLNPQLINWDECILLS